MSLVATVSIMGFTDFAATKPDKTVDEATLRAVIILKIIHLVNWPSSFDKEIHFCSAGNSKAILQLHRFQGKKITQENAQIRFLDDDSEEMCHIQILGANVPPEELLRKVAPLLVICDSCDNSGNIAAVELVKDRDHIRFILDPEKAQQNNIQFKVSLLELAQSVKGHNGR